MPKVKTCEEASAKDDFAHQAGLSGEEIYNRYTQWADSNGYEEDLRAELYRGPQIAAETVSDLFKDVQGAQRKEIKVLDIAAGTGFVAEKLCLLGFSTIDALEPSEGMARLARKKGVYRRIVQEFLNTDPTEIETDYYDVAVSSGGMGEGHIPCSGLEEMIRVVRPGGYVVIVMREAYVQSVAEYKDRLEPHMDSLAQAGRWEPVMRRVVPRYSFIKNNGLVFVFKVKPTTSSN